MSDWLSMDTAPRDREILVYGIWAGEINGISEEPCRSIVQYSRNTDYPGFDWFCTNTDGYAAWMKPVGWMPLPEIPVNP